MSKSKRLIQPSQNKDYTFHPSQLSEVERAKHVVQSLIDYNEGIIKNNPSGANMKFNKLKSSPFVFMRGTADLMYRDFHGTDADKSIVLCVGDVHLENYGVMETEDGSLVWGLNDFDESNFAPFTWDVKRGATSIILAALDENVKKPFSKLQAKKLARSFAESYLDIIEKGIDKKDYPFKLDQGSSPQDIENILETASKIDEDEYLRKNYLDTFSSTPRFKNTDEIERIIAHEGALNHQIEESLNIYIESLNEVNNTIPRKIRVWDLATKKGSGTGSIGLWRYYALVELIDKKSSKILILEIKQERKSVLDPYVGGGLLKFHSEGSRVAYAEDIHLHNANPFYGYTTIGEVSYLVRKRSPYKKRVSLEKLKKLKQFKSYTEACGQALAFAHLQSVNVFLEMYPKMGAAILHTVNPETFGTDISGFASKMAQQVKLDWKYFTQALNQGQFEFS